MLGPGPQSCIREFVFSLRVWSGRRGSNPRPTAWKAVTLPLSYSRLRALRARSAASHRFGGQARHTPFENHSAQPASQQPSRRSMTSLRALSHRVAASPHESGQANTGREALPINLPRRDAPTFATRRVMEGWWGGEGSNLRSPKAAGLQPAAIDRSATSPNSDVWITFGIRAFGAFLKTLLSSNDFGATAAGGAHFGGAGGGI